MRHCITALSLRGATIPPLIWSIENFAPSTPASIPPMTFLLLGVLLRGINYIGYPWRKIILSLPYLTYLSPSRYRKNVEKMSRMFRSRPMTPSETAAYWVDHVIKFGGQHYRPLSLDAGFLSGSLWDVWGTLAILSVVTIYVLTLTINLIVRLCSRSVALFFLT